MSTHHYNYTAAAAIMVDSVSHLGSSMQMNVSSSHRLEKHHDSRESLSCAVFRVCVFVRVGCWAVLGGVCVLCLASSCFFKNVF